MRTPTSDSSHGTDFQDSNDDFSENMIDSDVVAQLSDHKLRRWNRGVKQKRRKVPKASHPGLGMEGRRMRKRKSVQ